MALCGIHDTPENRSAIHAAWQMSMAQSIETATRNAAYFATRGVLFMLSIYYSAGGSLTLPCLDAVITDYNTLKVTASDGTISFFPMQHITRYDLSPLQYPRTVEPRKTATENSPEQLPGHPPLP
jgi:hypothetical protein